MVIGGIIAKVLEAVLRIYFFILVIRIIMTWMPHMAANPANAFLARITDPYLAFCRRFRGLSFGGFDFSPVLALMMVSVAAEIAGRLGSVGYITLGVIIALVLNALWSMVSFLLGFFAIAVLARTIAHLARWNVLEGIWPILDSLVHPVVGALNRIVYRDRIVAFTQQLVTAFIILAGLRFAGGALVGLASRLLEGLPL